MNPWPRQWWKCVPLVIWSATAWPIGFAMLLWSLIFGKVKLAWRDGALEVWPVAPEDNHWVFALNKHAICIPPCIFFSWKFWELEPVPAARLHAHERWGHIRQSIVFGPFMPIFVALGHLGYGARNSPLEVHARAQADMLVPRIPGARVVDLQ